jgi:RNA polymerase sigma factor (sigma-70 family)
MPSGFLRRVRSLALTREGCGLSDAELLSCFAEHKDVAAFEALVRRHGPMVLGTCRRVLGDTHDAEDAFQAVFLVLVRKAASVTSRETVGGWLYGVAYRTALAARTKRKRRRAREKQVDAMPELAFESDDTWRELKLLLDKELSRLPEKFRVPVVLCDLEGLPRRQVARQLGLAEGTLSSRLHTARRTLAQRLSRYGFALSGGALAASLTRQASAAVPSPLLVSTVKVASGEAVAASAAVALSKEVFKTMFLAKLKLAVGAVMVVAALGAGGVAYQVSGPRPAQAAPEAKPVSELEALRKENELLKLNLQVVLEKVRAQEAELRAVKGSVEALLRAVKGSVEAPSKERGVEIRTAFPADKESLSRLSVRTVVNLPVPDPAQQVEAALKAFREAKDPEAKRRSAEALEQAAKKLKEQPQKKPEKPGNQGGKK